MSDHFSISDGKYITEQSSSNSRGQNQKEHKIQVHECDRLFRKG